MGFVHHLSCCTYIERVNGGSQIGSPGSDDLYKSYSLSICTQSHFKSGKIRDKKCQTNILGFKRCVGQCLNFDKCTKAVLGSIHMSISVHSAIDDASGCFPVTCGKEFNAYS